MDAKKPPTFAGGLLSVLVGLHPPCPGLPAAAETTLLGPVTAHLAVTMLVTPASANPEGLRSGTTSTLHPAHGAAAGNHVISFHSRGEGGFPLPHRGD